MQFERHGWPSSQGWGRTGEHSRSSHRWSPYNEDSAAIIKAEGGNKCCVVVDGKVQQRPIELGLRVGDDVEIQSGLDGTETVVLVRASSLQAGQSVEIIKKQEVSGLQIANEEGQFAFSLKTILGFMPRL